MATNGTLNATNATLNQQNRALQARNDALVAANATLDQTTQISVANQNNATLTARVNTLETENTRLNAEVAGQSQLVVSANHQISRANAAATVSREELQRSQHRVRDLHRAFAVFLDYLTHIWNSGDWNDWRTHMTNHRRDVLNLR
jgi:cell division protein FtsB